MPSKLESLLKSRKFWALIIALGSILSGYLSGNMAAAPAIQAAIAALAAYMVGTGLESQSAAQIRPDVPAVRTIASPKR